MSCRILLIQSDADDALAVRKSLLALPDANIQIEWLRNCADGERRLGIAPSETVAGITAIISDLFLSDTQGIDTINRLSRAAPHIPILLLCNPRHEAIAKLAIEYGAHGYLIREGLSSEALANSLRSMTRSVASLEVLSKDYDHTRAVLNSIGDPVVSVDIRGNITYLNLVAESLIGWSRAEAVGTSFEKVLLIIDATTRECVPNPLAAAILTNRAVALPQNSVFVRRDGVEIAIEDSTAPIHDRHGRLTGAVMVFRDVSAARAETRMLAHLAWHDCLTDLPNSTLFLDRLTQAMALARRHGHRLSVIFIDIDRFKLVNDELGHINGDRLLQSVALRLQSCVRNTDTVSRRGGDEFVILLSEVMQVEDAALSAEKMLAALSEPHCIGQSTIQVTASMGIATYPDDGADAEALLRNADLAMYHAKSSGRSCYQFFKPALNTRAIDRQDVETGLRQAIARNEFILHYQPKINLITDAIFGVEVLVRWNHPLQGLVLPQAFMAIAEETGLIVPLGRWVLHEACRQAREWRDAGLPALRMAINVSPLELRSSNFVAEVCAVLLETGLEPSDLELELTESVLLHDSNRIVETLHALKKIGVHLALDDFGVGRSSLNDLKRLPIDTLNLGPSVLRHLGTVTGDTDVFANAIGAVIGMSMNMQIRVVAKGIETHDELLFLQSHHCAGGQGYYFSQPLDVPEITRLLEEIVQTNCQLA